MSEMRLQFEDDEMKNKLIDLAKDLGLSLNALVNKILSARFSDKDSKYLQLMIEIAEFKKVNNVG
ncbi:MAG: hypothetical protein E6778_23405 [Niallia nealsonii]|nr:hypothetical protein [Niallia nealsonii]